MIWKRTVEVVGVGVIGDAIEFTSTDPFLFVGCLFVQEDGQGGPPGTFPGWASVDAAEILVCQVTVGVFDCIGGQVSGELYQQVVLEEVLASSPSIFMPRVGAGVRVKVTVEGWSRTRATHVLFLGFRVEYPRADLRALCRGALAEGRIAQATLKYLDAEEEWLWALSQRVSLLQQRILGDRIAAEEQRRACSSIDGQVRTLFERVLPHQERRATPGTPSAESLRQGLRIWAEEVVELLEACFSERDAQTLTLLGMVDGALRDAIDTGEIAVDLPLLADACADVDATTAGLRVRCGVDGEPIRQLVHAANMAKAGGPVDAHGKCLKPEGWQPPDVAGELRRQGWEG
jgi:predicted HAD superfamily Cof-like phosphohydrolase